MYTSFCRKNKQLAVLVDPDKYDTGNLKTLIALANESSVSYFFVGGSLLTDDRMESVISTLRSHSTIPVVIFPGDTMQINNKADAILLLSLISGRNADMLIGKHVVAAPYLKKSGLEILPTGYMLIESGRTTTALYMSNSLPIPHDKDEIAVSTAMAGEMLGLKIIYMDGGSGAQHPISVSMIAQVKHNITVPLIVGGGIRTAEEAYERFQAGADIIVVGNAIEDSPSLLKHMAEAAFSLQES